MGVGGYSYPEYGYYPPPVVPKIDPIAQYVSMYKSEKYKRGRFLMPMFLSLIAAGGLAAQYVVFELLPRTANYESNVYAPKEEGPQGQFTDFEE